MQDGREPGPDDVAIEGEENRENVERPSGPDTGSEEVAPAGGEMPGADEEGISDADADADPDAVHIADDKEEPAPDPEEAQSPT